MVRAHVAFSAMIAALAAGADASDHIIEAPESDPKHRLHVYEPVPDCVLSLPQLYIRWAWH